MATPPDFTAGQILTAAQMNTIGLWLVKTQVVGSAVSSVVVSSAFNADFDNYLITYNDGSCSANTHVSLQLGSTTSGYTFNIIGNSWSATASNTGGTASANFTYAMSGFSANGVNGSVEVMSPFLAKFTQFGSDFVAGFGGYRSTGYLPNTTSYTAFTLIPASGTLTGGTIRVYGYRK
jgi:hypothetical protein